MPSNKKPPQELADSHGEEYVEQFMRAHSPARLERLLDYVHLEQDYCVADFACGNGLLMPYVAPRVASYVGVDFSEDFIKKANEKKNTLGIHNAEFQVSDVKLFCKNNPRTFDCAFAIDFSEHVYDDEWLQILISIRESLRDGGLFYMHTPNALFFVERMKAHSFILRQPPQHIAVRSPDENARLLLRAGYTIRRILLLPHYNALKFVHFMSSVPLLGRYFEARIFIEAAK